MGHSFFPRCKRLLISWLQSPSALIFSSVQSLSHVRLFATPWTAACQAFLSITNSWSLLKLMPIESVMPSSHHIFCHPLLLLPSIFPSIRVFSRQHIKKQRYYSASKGPSSQGYGFSSSHVWMWELDYKESWAPKNWCFWTVVLEKTPVGLGLQGDPTSQL